MEQPKVQIYGIMACNVYWDFEKSPRGKFQHKFLISFYPTPGVFTPDLIETIIAYGPDDYKVQFSKDQKFDNENKDGWIFDPTYNNYWYMINLDAGFMKEGEYTIEVTCKNGEVLKKSRYQDNRKSNEILNAYLKNQYELYTSFEPSRLKPLPADSPLKDIKCKWKTLKDVADVDAYYVTRVAEASTSLEFDTQQLVWWDNIYVQKMRGDATAGINRGEIVITTELKPKTSYGYFVEITDGNVQEESNICIFQPHQFFVTP